MMTNKMIVIFDVPRTLMKDIIEGNLDGTMIITMKEGGTPVDGHLYQ